MTDTATINRRVAEKVKTRPILFNGDMVRALLDGRKTMTRRAIKPQPVWAPEGDGLPAQWGWDAGYSGKDDRNPKFGMSFTSFAMTDSGFADCIASCAYAACPYGVPGDLLWVKETTVDVEEHGYAGPVYVASDEASVIFDWGLRPDPDDMCEVDPDRIKLRPSIFMKRRASRLTLRVTDVRVERVKDITAGDAKAEGIESAREPGPTTYYIDNFRQLWDSINAKRGYGWDANPWVWVVSFEVIRQNVDEYLKARGAGA